MKLLFKLIGLLSFLALIGSALYLGYGYALQYIQTEIHKVEEKYEDSNPLIEINIMGLYIKKDVSKMALSVKTELLEISYYLETDFPPNENIEEVAPNDFNIDNYYDLTFITTTDAQTTKDLALTLVIVFGATWIACFVLKRFF